MPRQDRPRGRCQFGRARVKRYHLPAQLGEEGALGQFGVALFAGVEKGRRVGHGAIGHPIGDVLGEDRDALAKAQKDRPLTTRRQQPMPRRDRRKPAPCRRGRRIFGGKQRTTTPEGQDQRGRVRKRLRQKRGIATQMRRALQPRTGKRQAVPLKRLGQGSRGRVARCREYAHISTHRLPGSDRMNAPNWPVALQGCRATG